ncbi:hypothetical protein EDB83DRAFT_2529202 [Lactarius deliciosus]|nr:hypothetical protein EDB83DRAFT_2529202 [Lactarius deliciosus]
MSDMDGSLSCERVAFAYHSSFPSWPQEELFKPRSIRCEQPVVGHGPLVTCGFWDVAASGTGTTTTPDELPPSSQSTTDSELHSSPLVALKLQPTLAHSETEVQPELEPTGTFDLSTSPSSLPHPTPSSMSYSLAPSATDDDSELTFLPSASSVSSVELECPPSPMRQTTEDHLEHEPVRTLLIIPTSLSLPSTLLLASPSAGAVPEITSVSPAELPANLVRPPSAFGLPPSSLRLATDHRRRCLHLSCWAILSLSLPLRLLSTRTPPR